MDEPFDVDLGDGHWLQFSSWAPDRSIPSNAERYAGLPDVHPGAPKWTVESWEPLTLSPSLLCRACGDHGFVRAGKWVRC